MRTMHSDKCIFTFIERKMICDKKTNWDYKRPGLNKKMQWENFHEFKTEMFKPDKSKISKLK